MQYVTYQISSQFSAEIAFARVQQLLASEGVQCTSEGLSLSSTSTPVALLSFQRISYTHKNWVGLNPFTFVSGIRVRCQPGRDGRTEAVVEVNRSRTFLYVALWGVSTGGAALAAPTFGEFALLFGLLFLAGWFGYVSFLAGYLVKKEIADCLHA
jgi:hypothetical protein